MAELSPQQLLHHAQQLVTLSSPAEVLAAACRGLLALTGTARGFAAYSLPGDSWDRAHALQATTDASRAASPAARSALFAVHRRLAAHRAPLTVNRGHDTAPIFAGLGCAPHVHELAAIPIVHRTGRLWGELVLVGGETAPDPRSEGIAAMARLTTVALENAQRLGFARRDQDRLLVLAEATEDALWDYNLDSRDLWWGGGIVKLLGSGGDLVVNSVEWKLERMHPEDRPRVEVGFQAALASTVTNWTAEYRFRSHGEDYRSVEDRCYFLRDAHGRAYRVIGAMRDVTAMRTFLDREHQLRAQAESASRAKDEFLAMLGHELRNPLAPIVTGLQLLRMRGIADKELTVLERQAKHLIRLVDDLLDISRIAHAKITLAKSRLELAGILATAVEMVMPLIEEKGHALVVDAAQTGLEVDADHARLAQALANLVTNAAKYTEPGGRIAIAARRTGDTIELEVRDTGIGIAPDMLPRIFELFVQERQALDRARGGLGLGLSIVKSLIELHGGTVSAHSDGVGRGSRFTISLPAACVAQAEQPQTAQQAAAELVTRGRRIMVVDDNQDAADLLSMLLEHLGNTTRVAHDARDALAVIDEFHPDLAVLDIGLPVMDGFELARRLRAQPHTAGMRLIALTGYGQAADRERAVEAGFDAHLVKPIELDTLDAVIRRLLADGRIAAS